MYYGAKYLKFHKSALTEIPKSMEMERKRKRTVSLQKAAVREGGCLSRLSSPSP